MDDHPASHHLKSSHLLFVSAKNEFVLFLTAGFLFLGSETAAEAAGQAEHGRALQPAPLSEDRQSGQ